MESNQIRKNIYPGLHVFVAVKKNGKYLEQLYEGYVRDILTNSKEHWRGIKVRLSDGTVGRVQEIISENPKN